MKIIYKESLPLIRLFCGGKFLLLLICCIGLSACSTSPKPKSYRELSKEDRGNDHYKGHYKIGKEYSIKGKTYKPRVDINYNQVGIASWYGSKNHFHGKKTANGDKYNKYMLTGAHRHLPLPSLVRVTNLNNNKSLIIMLNDRGPFAKNRIIDVSEKAAEILNFKRQGTAKVKVQYLHKETQEFLHKISLKPKENSIAKKKLANPKCSVNCHIKLVNLKHKLPVTP
jgi:rare lipoprotein A